MSKSRLPIYAVIGVSLQLIAALVSVVMRFLPKWVNFDDISDRSTYASQVLAGLVLLGWCLILIHLITLKETEKAYQFTEKYWIRPIRLYGSKIFRFATCVTYPIVIVICAWLCFRCVVPDWAISSDSAISGRDWARIVKAVVWPLLTFIAIFIFWGPLSLTLSQLPGLVRRSRYDNRTIKYELNGNIWQNPIDFENVRDTVQKGELDCVNTVELDAKSCDKGRMIENRILNSIRNEFWPVIIRKNAYLDNVHHIFDFAFNHNGWIYNVEMKSNAHINQWRRLIESIDSLYESATVDLRQRFIFMPCIVSSDSKSQIFDAIALLLRDKPYFWELREYDFNGKNVNVRRS